MARRLLYIYQRLYLIILGANLTLAFFHLLYLSVIPYTGYTVRDLSVLYWPPLAERYDPVYGIEPHRVTEKSLRELQAMRAAYRAGDEGWSESLNDLHEQFLYLHEGDYFTLANKAGSFERIKNLMRARVDDDSASRAFEIFFTPEHFMAPGIDGISASQFLAEEIEPLLATNYFRWIGEDGRPTDFFHRIDLFFVLFFLFDFLARWIWWFLREKQHHHSWYRFAVRHWYEIPLLIPFHHSHFLRLMRIIPLYARLRTSGVLHEDLFLPEILHENASLIANEISTLVVINTIDRTIRQVESSDPEELSRMARAGLVQKLEIFLSSEMHALSHSVLPQLEGRITELVVFSVRHALEPWLLSPAGKAVQMILPLVEGGVRDGIRGALVSEGGRRRIEELSLDILRKLLHEVSSVENLRENRQEFCEILRELRSQIVEMQQRQESGINGEGPVVTGAIEAEVEEMHEQNRKAGSDLLKKI